jgi:predicted transglutaminase-like cysteine proteinase
MIKKLIISAVVLTALISGKEANAAGAAGFARSLSTFAAHGEVAGLAPPSPSIGFTSEKRAEIVRISAAVEDAIKGVDAYFDTFAEDEAKVFAPETCVDCADIKREQLIGLGWSADALRISYAISAQGRIERVLIVETALGELLVGSRRPTFIGQQDEQDLTMPVAAQSHYDI